MTGRYDASIACLELVDRLVVSAQRIGTAERMARCVCLLTSFVAWVVNADVRACVRVCWVFTRSCVFMRVCARAEQDGAFFTYMSVCRVRMQHGKASQE